MASLFEALETRRDGLRGSLASREDYARLADCLQGAAFESILRVYRELPVCGCIWGFVVDDSGFAQSPGSDFMENYDPVRDHEFDWLSPAQILFHIRESYAGPSAFAAGFVPIGIPTIGGDCYFLRWDKWPEDSGALYRVYYDWIDPHAELPVVPDALRVVAKSVLNVIEVARIVGG